MTSVIPPIASTDREVGARYRTPYRPFEESETLGTPQDQVPPCSPLFPARLSIHVATDSTHTRKIDPLEHCQSHTIEQEAIWIQDFPGGHSAESRIPGPHTS